MSHHQSSLGRPSSGKRRLKELLTQRDNRACADCGAPDPKWASANIGVFICLKCCGVHRSLGTHISKVLSVTLDEWSDEEIDSMIEVGGNASANSIYEAYIPEGVSKPGPDAGHEERSNFIRGKYELQEFLKPSLRILSGPAKKHSLETSLSKKIMDSFRSSTSQNSEDIQNLTTGTGEKGDDLIRILRELTSVQRKIADLQVELQGRKEDKNVAHLTHVSEMEKKIDTLARITDILKDVIQNKDRIIARLQQPYSLDCIPVEAEFQKQFSELLMKAASDYGALTASVGDFQWSQNFKEPPIVWGEMLRPIPVALASCTRFFEAVTAMRESFAKLQTLRVGHPSQRLMRGSDCITPPPWRSESSFDDLAVGSLRRQGSDQQEGSEAGDLNNADGTSHRRLSWPPSVKKNGP